jgi:hypothetical protein
LIDFKIYYGLKIASQFKMLCGKRKGEGIPSFESADLLVYGRNGEKEVEDWWKRWRPKIEGRGVPPLAG